MVFVEVVWKKSASFPSSAVAIGIFNSLVLHLSVNADLQ